MAPCTTSMLVGDHLLGLGPSSERAVSVPEVTIREDSRIVGEFHEDPGQRTLGRVLIVIGGVAWLGSSIAAFTLENKTVAIVGGVASVSFVIPGVMLVDGGQARGAIQVSPLRPAAR